MHKIVPCLLVLLFCLSACSAKPSSPEERITSLVTTLYNVPDDFHKKNYEQLLAADGPESQGKAVVARINYDRGRFHKDDFAPGVLAELTKAWGQSADAYLEVALLPLGASVSCDSVTCEQEDDGSYKCTIPVTLTDKDGISADVTVIARAKFDGEGRFTDFNITDPGQLNRAIRELQ